MPLAAALGRAAAPLLRLRTLPVASAAVSALSRRLVLSGLSTASSADEPSLPAPPSPPQPPPPPALKLAESLGIEPEHRRWKDQEAEILRDIEPVMLITKDILHSSRYRDGECLSAKDEKVVVEKLLAYHPRSEDKIGCGLDAIMVDRHPQFRYSRCLFVVRTDGVWIDFSYQKCLRAYIREKYPSHAERFIREHFKRS